MITEGQIKRLRRYCREPIENIRGYKEALNSKRKYDCLIKWKVEQLCNDPFWVKQDRLFQLRHARQQHRLLSEANKSVEASTIESAIRREEEATL